MDFKSNKGVTLMALTITIIVMLIITSTVIYNTKNHIRVEKLNKFYNDIENIDSKIEDYYLKYGEVPTIGEVYCNKTELENLLTTNSNNANVALYMIDNVKINPNDGDEYFITDLHKLDGLTLNYGYDDYKLIKEAIEKKESIEEFNEIYIINKESHQIYYPAGIITDGKMYYSYNFNSKQAIFEYDKSTDSDISLENSETSFDNKDIFSISSFKIYGNGSTDVTSVGDITNNLFNSDLINSTNISKVENGFYAENYATSISSDSVEYLKGVLKPNVTYTLSRIYTGTVDASNGMISIRNSSGAIVSCGVGEGLKSVTFSLTQEQIDSITSVIMYFHKNGGTISNVKLYDTSEYYKIPVTCKVANLFNIDKLKGQENGVAVNYDNKTIFLNKKTNIPILGQNFTGVGTSFNKFNEVLNLNGPGYYCLKVKLTSEVEDLRPRADWVFNYIELNVDGTTTGRTMKPITKTYQKGAWFFKYQFTEEILDVLKNNSNTFRIYMYTTVKAGTTENVESTLSDITFVKGDYTIDTMPDYQPYMEPITTNVFVKEPLRKVGDVADYIDFVNKKVVRRIAVNEAGELYVTNEYTLEGEVVPDIEFNDGTNIITVDTETEPSNIEFKYLKINEE